MVIINSDYTIAWYNQLYEQWFGVGGEIEGRNCFEVFEGRDAICPGCPSRKTFETGESIVTLRTGITTSIGADRILTLTTSPIRDDNGKVIQVVEITQDSTAPKLAEERLKVQEKILNKSQEIAHLGSWHLDIKKNVLTWSDETYRIFGRTPQEFSATYEAFLDTIHPDDRAMVDTTYTNAIKNKEPYECTHRIIRDDGEIRIVFEKSEDVVDENGETIHSFGFTHDITERKQAEDQISLLSSLVDIAPASIMIHDFEGHILYANQQALEMHGYSLEEFLSINLSDLDVPEAAALIDSRMRQIAKTGIASFEVSHYRKDHTVVPLEAFVKMTEWGGKMVLFSIATDITERTKADESVRKAKEEWEKTFDAMSDIITIQDKDMRIIRANKATHDAFQVEPGALNGKYCYEVFREAQQPCSNCPELSTLKEKTTHSANITHKNLGMIFHVTSSPLLDGNGELTHIVHIAKDITEQKKMEDELFQAHKMEAIGTLAGGIAHDFNNILTAILGYADMARDDIPEFSHSRDYLDQVLKAGNRAKDLVKQVLTFSRKGPEIRQPMQPSSIVKEGLKLMRASLPSTIEIRENIDSNCKLILANPTNIHLILVNLCTNALHAMEDEKGILTVKLTQVELKAADVTMEASIPEGTFVEFMVSDTGCGMDKPTFERIFEPYFTTKGVGKGTGMGLALVHGIVQSCGGFIRVESEPGKGTTFHIYFPALDEKNVEVTEEKQELFPTGDGRILAVDDEEVIVGMYQTTLEKLGYKLSAYSSSEQAFEVFRDSPDNFDLVITDQTMPGIGGSELAKKILQIRPDIPIILCTGYSSLISEEKFKEIGIERFLMKPVSRKDLAITVREVLDNKKSWYI